MLKKQPKSSEAQLFNEYCGLTCLGGSEKKQCACDGPKACELRNDPRFLTWRQKAMGKLLDTARYAGTEAPKAKE